MIIKRLPFILILFGMLYTTSASGGGMVVGGPLNGTIIPGNEGGMVVGGPFNGSVIPGNEGGMIVGGPMNGTIVPRR